MARAIVYGGLAILGLVILVGIGWLAALTYAFLVACGALVTWLIGRAHDTAEEHGIYRFYDH